MIENHRKSLIQKCELTFRKKFFENAKIVQLQRVFENLNLAVKQCYQKISKLKIKWDILGNLILLIVAFSTNFCPIEIDMYGNTVWPLKMAKSTIFGIF